MLWTKVRCQTLRPHFIWSHKPLHPTRQFSHTAFRPFLRQSQCLRQEISPNASLRENVHLPAGGPSFYEKISKPGIWKQVTVSCVNSFACGVADPFPPKFVTVTSFLAFSLAATQTTIETEYWTERMVAASSVWTLTTITNTDLKRAQTAELIQVRTPTKCLWLYLPFRSLGPSRIACEYAINCPTPTCINSPMGKPCLCICHATIRRCDGRQTSVLENLFVECWGVARLEAQAVEWIHDCPIYALSTVRVVLYPLDQYVQVCGFKKCCGFLLTQTNFSLVIDQQFIYCAIVLPWKASVRVLPSLQVRKQSYIFSRVCGIPLPSPRTEQSTT